MKIIEAMRKVKMGKEKIADLRTKIGTHCANLNIETPLYPDTKQKVREWLQSCEDTAQENVRLLVAIARTNLATSVTIELGGEQVTKTVAEWVWRRREYAALDLAVWDAIGDRNLRESVIQPTTPGGAPTEVKIVRHYDPEVRDAKRSLYREEPSRIDAALEIVNAVTELLES